MYKHNIIFFLFFSFLGINCILASTAQNVEKLQSSEKSIRSQGLSELILNNDPSSYHVLRAIYEKKLYQYNGRLVTIGEKKPKAKITSFQLVQLFPHEISTDSKGKPIYVTIDQLNEIKFSRTARMAILPLFPFMNLADEDEDKRKLAYVEFQNRGDAATLSVITVASKNEKKTYMQRLATETILAIKLQNADTKELQLEILDLLRLNQGDNSMYIVKNYMKSIPDNDSKFRAQVQEVVDSLESRESFITGIQIIFSGISLGSILILVALGLSIIYGLAGVINMAHGEFVMIGAYSTFCMQGVFKSSLGDMFFWISLPVSFVTAGLFGLIIEKLVIRKLYNRPLESLLATWGISLVLIQLSRTVFGDVTSVTTPAALSGGMELVPQLILPYNRVFIIVMTILLVGLTYLFLFRTRSGLRIRSVTQNRAMSSCLGISTVRIDSLTFFVGSGIAGIAGCCMTLIGNVVPDMGQTYIVDSFLVVVTGGVGNMMGTIVSGLSIGQLSKILEPIFHAVYGKVLILVLIILFLQFKPKGLFPAKGRIAED